MIKNVGIIEFLVTTDKSYRCSVVVISLVSDATNERGNIFEPCQGTNYEKYSYIQQEHNIKWMD